MKWVRSGLPALAAMLVATAASAVAPSEQELLNRSLRQHAISGTIPELERLIREGAEINSAAPYGETALEYAVRFGRHKAALRLVELGADPNRDDDSGVTPLQRASGDCNASRVVEALLKAGAKVNHRDLYGRTSHADCARTVAVLLAHDIDHIEIDARSDALETAAGLARDGRVAEMLELARRYQQGSIAEDFTASLERALR